MARQSTPRHGVPVKLPLYQVPLVKFGCSPDVLRGALAGCQPVIRKGSFPGQQGAPPGTRTPNPRIKSGLLGRTEHSACTNVSGICPDARNVHECGLRSSTSRSTASRARPERSVTVSDGGWLSWENARRAACAGAGQMLIKTWAAPIWRICVRRRDATGTTLAAPCSPNPASSSCAGPGSARYRSSPRVSGDQARQLPVPGGQLRRWVAAPLGV
jgi:hypothetical protein